jgi:AsmA-like protein
MWVGQSSLQRVITAPERFRKGCQIGLHHLESTGIKLRKLCLPLDDMQRRLPFGTRLREDQGPILKVECEQADFAGDRGADRLPSKTPRDHQVEDEKQFAVRFNDHAFAQSPQTDHPASFDGGQRWVHGPQQKRARQPYRRHTPPDDARFQRSEVQKNVWEFGHCFLLPYAWTVVRRVLLILVGILLVVAGGLVIGFYRLMSGDSVRQTLERQATSWLGQPVKIGAASARIFPRPGLALHDVRAGEPVRLMLSDLQISTGLRPLWSRRIADAEITISNSRIDLPLPFTLPEAAPGGTTPSAGVQLESVRTIQLRNVTGASRGREITISADASLSQGNLSLQRFTATSGASTLEAHGDIRLSPRLDADIQVNAAHVDVDDLIALADAFAPRTPRRGPATAALLPGRIVARVTAQTARASGVDLRQFVSTLVAQGNRITLSPVSFQLFGGTYRGALDVDSDVGSLRATVRTQINDLDVAQLAAFGGAADTITGRLSGSGTFNGRGATVADAIAAAAGEGQVTISNGSVKRLGLVRTIVLFFGRPAPDAAASTDKFDRIDATFAVVRQVVAASALSMHSPDLDLVGQGTLTIPTKALDGHVDASLSEALSAQAGTDLARYTREENRIVLPVVVGGTLTSPRVTVDAGAAVRRGLRNEVQRRLKDILGTIVPAPPD